MRAAILEAFGRPLVVRSVPDPVIGTGEVVVDVAAAPVLSYTHEIISNARRYPIEPPLVLGCGAIGRVRATGPDATRLAIGDWVFCDPMVRSRDDARDPDITLQGWSTRGTGGLKLARHHHDGPFATQIRVPTENAIAIGPIDPADAPQWASLCLSLVPYGGWLAGRLAPGETVAVSGATGHFGSAAVAVAIAMGAARVVAPGRNTRVLADLVSRFGERVTPVTLCGDAGEDTARIASAAGPIDVVLDLLPPSVSTQVVRAAAMAVRRRGRIVLMGGVGMLGGDDLALPYPWIMRNDISIIGQWMYPPSAVPSLVALVRAGLLALDLDDVTTFPLEQANDAIAHAAEHGGAFRMTVIAP